MKTKIFSLLFILNFSGCAIFQLDAPTALTLQTDTKLGRAEYYAEMASAYAHENQLESAIEYDKLSLLHNPLNVNVRLHLADQYHQTGADSLALAELKTAREIQPQHVPTLQKLAEVYAKAGLTTEAHNIYSQLTQLEPSNESWRWARAQIFKTEKQYVSALGELSLVVINDKNHVRLSLERAELYRLAAEPLAYSQTLQELYSYAPRNREVAVAYFDWLCEENQFWSATKVLSAFSTTQEYDHEISQRLSFAALKSGQYELAIQEYDRQKDYAGADSLLNLKKARAFYLLGDVASAEKYYLSVLDNENTDEAQFSLGQIYAAQGDASSAQDFFSRVPPASEYFGASRVWLAEERKKTGDLVEALDIMEQAYARRDDQIDIFKSYGDLLIEKGNYPVAAQVLEKGMIEFPQNEDLRVKAAFAYYKLNRFDEFKRQVEQVKVLNPQNAEVYAMMAKLWHAEGKDLADTEFLVSKAVELKSKDKDIKPLLAWVLMQHGRSSEAIALFEESYEENPQDTFYISALAQAYRLSGIDGKASELSQRSRQVEWYQNLQLLPAAESKKVQASEKINSVPLRMPASWQDSKQD